MRALLAVAIGGFVGTGLRLACDVAFPSPVGGFPLETLTVNLLGALVLGFLVGDLWKRPSTPAWLRAGLGTGLLGSFTTMSAVMVALVALGEAGEKGIAIAYLGISVIGGVALAASGLRLGTFFAHRRMPGDISDRGETL